MTDEKNPLEAMVASSMRWAVARGPSRRTIELTIYDGGTAANIRLTPNEVDLMALSLLTNACSDFDAVATAQRLSALALACQVVAHSHYDLRPGELAEGLDVESDAAGAVFEGVANGG